MHINFNINYFLQPVTSRFKTTSSQKIILAITLIFSGCLAIYLAYQHHLSLKTKKVKLENSKSPLPIMFDPLAKVLPKEKPSSPKEIPAIGQKETQENPMPMTAKQAEFTATDLQHLPLDGLRYLASSLKCLDLRRLSQVNRFFHEFVNDNGNHPLILHSLLNAGNFPTGERLEIAKRIGKPLLKLDLSYSHVTNKNLQELSQHCLNIETLNLSGTNLTDDSIEYLPPSLKSLNLSLCKKLTSARVKDLPRGLQTLFLLNNNNLLEDVMINEVIENLPPTLTSLNLINYASKNRLLNVNVDKLPKTLTTLHSSIPCTTIPKLSQNLKNFYLHISDLSTVTTEEIIQMIGSLPRNLTTLSFYWDKFEINWTEEMIEKLPQQLTTLIFGGPHRLTALHKLPQSLEFLRLSDNRDLATLKDLPAGLKNLSLFQFNNLTEIENLPHNLIKLELGCCPKLRTIKQFSKNLTDLTLSIVPSLLEIDLFPEKLSSLVLKHCKALLHLNPLPENLTFFKLLECPYLTQMGNLPRNLRELDIAFSSLEEIEDLINCPLPNLTALMLPSHWSSDFLNRLFKQFPSNLNYLGIPMNHSELLENYRLDCHVELMP